jgi:AcrR family transcriptional regulator
MTTGRTISLPLTPARRRALTRQSLLEAASRVFADRGFHGASLDDVAAAAGFTKGAVYSNFKSKDDLFLALLEHHLAQDEARLRAAIDQSDVPPEERLDDFVKLVREAQPEGSPRWSELYQEFSTYALRNDEARTRLAELDRQRTRSLADLLYERRAVNGIASPEAAHHLALIVLCLMKGLDQAALIDPDSIDDAVADTAVAFIARGLTRERSE